MRFAGLVALLALSTGCAPDLTEIVVVVDTDLRVPTDIDSIEIRVEGTTPQTLLARAPLVGSFPVALPVTLGLTPKNGTVTDVTISAVGVRGGSDVLATTVRTQFALGRRVVLRLYLTRSCIGMDCGDGMTCNGGHCIAEDVDPMALEVFGGTIDTPDGSPVVHDLGTDAPARDLGVDGGAPDASHDLGVDMGPGPECTADAECTDGNRCNGTEHCVEMHCAPGTPLSCDDGVACTDDTCDGATGSCAHTPNAAHCTVAAGGSCDAVHGCQYTSCTGVTCTPTPGACEMAACAGSTCNRTSTCGAGTTCCAGACVPAGCDDGNACTDDACGASGCTHTNNANPCSDGNACTGGDHCAGGACTSGTAAGCDDGNPCTDDGCSPSSGCTHTDNAAGCDDGNACTSGDHCAAGACTGAAMNCDDGNACTDDGCSGGSCTHANNAAGCDDGNACTSGDVCASGVCGGAPISCDDADWCTIDSCIAATGCHHTLRHCGAGCICDSDLMICDCSGGCHPICP